MTDLYNLIYRWKQNILVQHPKDICLHVMILGYQMNTIAMDQFSMKSHEITKDVRDWDKITSL